MQERLDKFVANAMWRNKYGSSYVSHLEKRHSDHLPIVLCIRSKTPPSLEKKKRKLSRFEEKWMREEESGEVIEAMWRKGEDACGNISRMACELKEWSHKSFATL